MDASNVLNLVETACLLLNEALFKDQQTHVCDLETSNLRSKTIMAKTALVTGATGLLGRQVVKVFQRQGWDVVGTGFTRAKPPSIVKLDLGSEADIAKVLEDVK